MKSRCLETTELGNYKVKARNCSSLDRYRVVAIGWRGNGRRRMRQNPVADWMPLNQSDCEVVGPFRGTQRLEREGFWGQIKRLGVIIMKH